LRRIQAGLGARKATHGAADKLELRIFSSWRDSLANNPGRAGNARGHARGRRKVGSSYFFEMEGLSCEESGQGCTRAGTRTGLQEYWSCVFFPRLRVSLAKNPGREGCTRAGPRTGQQVSWSFVFFELEGLACEESGQGWVRAGPRPGQQESWSFVFF
jgi:hypothetical protein